MERSGSKNVDHYLDDFFFAGSPLCSDCANLMSQFEDLCDELDIPIASEKNSVSYILFDVFG